MPHAVTGLFTNLCGAVLRNSKKGNAPVRVIAGMKKGHTIRTIKAKSLRPATDRVREAIFSVLGDRLVDADVLDLYAGTGSLGIEALSRGARSATFVERDQATVECLRKNLDRLEFSDVARAFRQDVKRAISVLSKKGQRFSLIFADPPYVLADDFSRIPLGEMAEVLSESGTLVLRHRAGQESPETVGRLSATRTQSVGDMAVKYYNLTPKI